MNTLISAASIEIKEVLCDGRYPDGAWEAKSIREFVEYAFEVKGKFDSILDNLVEMGDEFIKYTHRDRENYEFVTGNVPELYSICGDICTIDRWASEGEISSRKKALEALIEESNIEIPEWGRWDNIDVNEDIKAIVDGTQYEISRLRFLHEVCERLKVIMVELVYCDRKVAYVEVNNDCSEATFFYVE